MTTPAVPSELLISVDAYNELLALVQWLETMPGWFDITDLQVDAIHERIKAPFDSLMTEDFWVGSVETGVVIRLIAIVEREDGSETRVPVGIQG